MLRPNSQQIFRSPDQRSRRSVLSLSLVFAVVFVTFALPATAQYGRGSSRANEIRVRIGLFEPEGSSEYWQFGEAGDPLATVFTGQPSDFEDVSFGVDYVRHLSPRLAFTLGGSAWEGNEDQAYLFFEDQFGDDIVHNTNLEIGTLTAGFLFHLFDRNRRIVPYVGAGGGFYVWTLTEEGDFIDFNAVPPEIFTTRFEDDGQTFGWYWNAGVRIGITRNWSFLAEYRKHDASDSLSGDFEGFGDIDLSGKETSGGFVWTF